MPRNISSGWTLVDLLASLVVVVLALALCLPMVAQAADAAKLAACEANLSSVGIGVIAFTADHDRNYPTHGLPTDADNEPKTPISPSSLVIPLSSYDIRPPLKDYLKINTNLQCPLTEQVDIVNTQPDENVAVSYAMWWGWRYEPAKSGALPGMNKVGDRFGWENHRFKLLAGDIDMEQGKKSVSSSHPDDDKMMRSVAVKYQCLFGKKPGEEGYTPFTISIWINREANRRGPVDLNFLYDDGSVKRYEKVARVDEERMVRIPSVFDVSRPAAKGHVPKD